VAVLLAHTPQKARLALHAALLGFTHPVTKERLRFESALPDELARWVDRLRPPATQTAELTGGLDDDTTPS